MSPTPKLVVSVCSSFAAFVGSWALVQYLDRLQVVPTVVFEMLFSLGHSTILGCLLPLWLSSRFRLRGPAERPNPWREIAGWAVYTLVLFLTLVGSGSASELWAHPPSPGVALRYALTFFPMTLSIALYCLHLIPRMIAATVRGPRLRVALVLLLPSVAAFLGFCADSLFSDMALAGGMAFMVFLLGVGQLLERRFVVCWAVLFTFMLLNTLRFAHHDRFSLAIAAVGTGLCLTGVAGYALWWRRHPTEGSGIMA